MAKITMFPALAIALAEAMGLDANNLKRLEIVYDAEQGFTVTTVALPVSEQDDALLGSIKRFRFGDIQEITDG